jgi:uridine phosphorylase
MNSAELILNPDGSIYHLNLLPEDIAPTVILVGDPGRVVKVSKYFNIIDVIKQKREFITHTGWIGSNRITVISTGIGTDNIDIVVNELDALVNIDFETRQPKKNLTSLNLVRIGTSGSIHPDIHLDEIVVSGMAVGTDTLGMYYAHQMVQNPMLPSWSYLEKRYPFSLGKFPALYTEGITLTCPGFYGPQGRALRTTLKYKIPIDLLHTMDLEGMHFSNLEMESSAIYLFANLLGHKAISFNVILAQRLQGKFSSNSANAMDTMIQATLEWIHSISSE